jgi:DNA modification methylase
MSVRIFNADVMDGLAQIPDESVHCIVTSPPYWGLRDYGVQSQIGLEPTLNEYVEKLTRVFREVRRVLRKDGTLWLNLGDSYAGGGRGGGSEDCKQRTSVGSLVARSPLSGLKPKDLCGVPWRVAFALQADGWWLRQDIIWSKPNPMPESVTDRCTKAHEYLFLLAKSERYYFDAEAIAEASTTEDLRRPYGSPGTNALDPRNKQGNGFLRHNAPLTRNKRSVWEIATQSFPEAHFATFPPALIEPCIKAGTSEKGCCAKCGMPWARQVEITRTFQSGSGRAGNMPMGKNGASLQGGGATRDIRRGPCTSTETLGWHPLCKCEVSTVPCTVLDPFGGSGTTGLVADRLKRNAILIELNPEYAAMAERRIKGDCPMFTECSA